MRAPDVGIAAPVETHVTEKLRVNGSGFSAAAFVVRSSVCAHSPADDASSSTAGTRCLGKDKPPNPRSEEHRTKMRLRREQTRVVAL